MIPWTIGPRRLQASLKWSGSITSWFHIPATPLDTRCAIALWLDWYRANISADACDDAIGTPLVITLIRPPAHQEAGHRAQSPGWRREVASAGRQAQVVAAGPEAEPA